MDAGGEAKPFCFLECGCWYIAHAMLDDPTPTHGRQHKLDSVGYVFFKDIELGQRKIGSLGEVRGRSWSCICQDIIYTYTYIDICIHRYTYHTHMDLAKNKQNVLKLLRSKPTGCSFVSL